MPVIGFLGSGSSGASAPFVAAFHQGLSETGYVDGQNVTIEYRWAEGLYDRLPAFAADLVARKAGVIATAGTPSAPAAKRATAAIHVALKVGAATYGELKARLDDAGEKFRETNHGYCKSIYTTSPDGLVVEFTCDPPDAAEIDALRRADAHSELQRWLGGDRRVNNQLRHREF